MANGPALPGPSLCLCSGTAKLSLDKSKLNEIGYWAVVISALITTILVVRKEFFYEAPAVPSREAVYIEDWQDLLSAGIRSGLEDAPVQLIEFADFECPFCANSDEALRKLRDKYGNQVALTFVHLPLPFHENAKPAARAAECAHNQGRFDEMRKLLFERQEDFGQMPWTEFASEVGIPDAGKFEICVQDATPILRVEQGSKLARKFGVRGTPTIIVNGWKFPVALSVEDLDTIVNNILNGKPPATDTMYAESN